MPPLLRAPIQLCMFHVDVSISSQTMVRCCALRVYIDNMQTMAYHSTGLNLSTCRFRTCDNLGVHILEGAVCVI